MRRLALFRLAFAAAPAVTALATPHPLTRWLILQKARRQALATRRSPLALRPSVSERFQVLFHSPHRGSFHLSLTVLVRYRSSRVFSLGGWSPRFPTGLACPVVLRHSDPLPSAFADGTLTRCGQPFQCCLASVLAAWCQGLQPHPPWWMVWAVPRSLATTSGIVSVPPGTEMFQFPGFPLVGLCVQPPVTSVPLAGFPHSDITGSQPAHGSPMLFAVYHVLRRLLMPRHPPFAFVRFFHRHPWRRPAETALALAGSSATCSADERSAMSRPCPSFSATPNDTPIIDVDALFAIRLVKCAGPRPAEDDKRVIMLC